MNDHEDRLGSVNERFPPSTKQRSFDRLYTLFNLCHSLQRSELREIRTWELPPGEYSGSGDRDKALKRRLPVLDKIHRAQDGTKKALEQKEDKKPKIERGS